jgi:uncharacterized protein YjdB
VGRLRKSSVLLLSVVLAAAMLPEGVFAETGGSSSAEGSAVTSGIQADASDADAGEMLDKGKYASGQLIVTYDDDMSSRTITKKVNNELSDEGGRAEAVGTASAVDTERTDSSSKATIIEFDGSTGKNNMEAAIETLQDSSSVKAVQPNYKYTVHEASTGAASRMIVSDDDVLKDVASGQDKTVIGEDSDDPGRSSSGVIMKTDPFLYSRSSYKAYQFSTMNIKKAWKALGNPKHKTKVGVIDVGCDLDHEDIKKLVVKSRSCTIESGKVTKRGYSADESAHGTHVSGIICATYGNGKGSAGVASGYDNDLCSVTDYDVSTDGESMYSFDILCGINTAVSDGMEVVNMSFGEYVTDYLLSDAIKRGYKKGVCFVNSSGNDSVDIGFNLDPDDTTDSSPSYLHEVICVNAVNSSNSRASFSNYGTYCDVSAPGVDVTSAAPGNLYMVMDGTSMAAPMVTGVIALMLDANPNLKPEQVYNIICATANDIGASGFDKRTGYGVVDAYAAVKAAKSASSSYSVSSLKLKKGMSDADMLVGETFQPEVVIKPAAKLSNVSWSSSNSSVATVSSNGTVTAVGAGSARITARSGSYSASVDVNVEDSVDVTKIEVQNKSNLRYMNAGEDERIRIYLWPSKASNIDLIYKSSNYNVVQIDANINLVTGWKEGTATVTVTSASNPDVSDSFKVTVKSAAKSIKITSGSSRVRVGKKSRYKCKVKPSSAAKKVKWKVSDRYRASITKSGVLTGKRPGKVYVIAQLPGGKRAIKGVKILKRK